MHKFVSVHHQLNGHCHHCWWSQNKEILEKKKLNEKKNHYAVNTRFAGPVKSGVDNVVIVDDIVWYTCRQMQRP